MEKSTKQSAKAYEKDDKSKQKSFVCKNGFGGVNRKRV